MIGLTAARVRVPCSTSNLGAGFDCVGLALDRYVEAAFEPGGKGLRIERAGTLAGLAVDVEGDTMAAAFLAALAARGVGNITGALFITSSIPVARGLGSSAAATVAGLLLAAAASGEQPDTSVLLEAAAAREGHPDNAAPALMGGLVAVVRDPQRRHRAFRLELSRDLGFAFAAPPVAVSTRGARRSLPESVTHTMAARGLGRVAALVRGLEMGNPDLLRAGFADEIHVPYRMPLIPGARDAFRAATGAGAYAVTISGSGSGLIAVSATDRASVVAEAMAAAFRAAATWPKGDAVIGMALEPDFAGGRILEV